MERPAKQQAEFESFNFASMLPDWDGFPIWWLSKRWRTSDEHWYNLIDKGELEICVDLRVPGASRSMTRVARPSLIAFLNIRKDLAAVLAANPKPKYRDSSKRRKRDASPGKQKGRS